ncbi:MAG: hypothetical protein M3Y91_17980 [Actinomycetota bacterium]|nr:hypothetical protein [Actinomycetota bacterium]
MRALTIALAKRSADRRDLAGAFAALLVATPAVNAQAQIEAYLYASRRPELRPAVARVMAAVEDVAEVTLRAAGVADPPTRVRAVVALADGFMLQHLANPRPDDRQQLTDALISLLEPDRP